jgi:hypothetical protein
VSEALIIEQQPTGGDIDAVGRQLDAAFTAMQGAVLADPPVPVTVVVHDPDLLGQGDPCDAAVATALLGMVRTLAIEGTKPGWQLNVVTGVDVADPLLARARDGLAAIPGLTGQLIRMGGTAHIGKVLP